MKDIEIVLCDTCDGAGVISRDELVDYHKRDYVTHTTTCTRCKGSGRLKKITEVTYEPYASPKTSTVG